MRVTDDGLWREVSEDAYRAFLHDHPRRDALRLAHEPIGRGDWWFAYNVEAFEASGQHTKHPGAFKVAYRVRETGQRLRFWIPAG